MQPRWRHVPPILSSSTSATFSPSWRAAERSGVPAGARAEHDEVEVVGGADGHGSGCLGAPRSRRQGRPGQVGHRDRWYARRRETRNRRAAPGQPAAAQRLPASTGPTASTCPTLRPADAAPVLDSGPRGTEPPSAPDHRWSVPLDPAIVLRTAGPDAGRLPRRLDPGRRPRGSAARAGRTRGRSAPVGPAGPTRCGHSGRKWAAVVVIGDLLKGALPVLLARYRHRRPARRGPVRRGRGGRRDLVGLRGFRSGRGVGTGRRDDARHPAGRRAARDAGLHRRHPADAVRVARVAARARRRCSRRCCSCCWSCPRRRCRTCSTRRSGRR